MELPSRQVCSEGHSKEQTDPKDLHGVGAEQPESQQQGRGFQRRGGKGRWGTVASALGPETIHQTCLLSHLQP